METLECYSGFSYKIIVSICSNAKVLRILFIKFLNSASYIPTPTVVELSKIETQLSVKKFIFG